MGRGDRSPKATLADIAGEALAGLLRRLKATPEAPALVPSISALPASPPQAATGNPPRLAGKASLQPMRKPVLYPKAPAKKLPAAAVAPAKAVHELAPKPPAFIPLDERQRLAAVRVREVVTAAFPAIDETRPERVSESTAAAVRKAVALGSQILAARPEPDLDAGFIVGIDFGTSAVKLAVAQPYQAGDPVKALTTPICLRSADTAHPHLWPTAVWFSTETGAFSLVPGPGSIPLDGFKAGLISKLGNHKAHPTIDVTRAEACAAFLALQLAHLFGQYALKKPLGAIGGGHFLSVNIGVPVDSMDRRDVVEAFKRVVQAAHSLAAHAADLDVANVRQALAAATPELPLGFDLVPELAAAVAGYAADPTTPSGPHMLVDVGAATLDIVAFNLVDRGQKVAVLASGVEMFGAASLDWARKGGLTDKDFKDACDHQFDRVYGHARSPERDQRGFHPAYRGSGVVRLVTTGGGCATSLHTRFIAEMVKPAVLGSATIGRPLPPSHIASAKCDRSRLLLAYGLTRDVTEIARCRLPSEIENMTKLSVPVPIAPSSKDMV